MELDEDSRNGKHPSAENGLNEEFGAGQANADLNAEQANDDRLKGFLLSTSAKLLEPQEVQRLSPAALAYLGDAVYELYIRTYYLMPPQRLQSYHKEVVAQVRAEAQANHLQMLQPYLTQAEQDIVRRGRNAAHRIPKRLAPEIYQQATSLETLLGYLYVTDPSRLAQLFAYLQPMLQQPSPEP